MNEFFPKIKKIKYEGSESRNPLAFKHYKANQKIMGKTLVDHLRFAICYIMLYGEFQFRRIQLPSATESNPVLLSG